MGPAATNVPEPAETADDPRVLRLGLYLAGASSRSTLTEMKLRRLLDRELRDGYALKVIDVLQHPERADTENIFLTPALIRRTSGDVRRLVGSVDQRGQVLWLIGSGQKPSLAAEQSSDVDDQGQTLADLCPDGLILVDPRGAIITANAAGRRFLGLEGQVLDGQMVGLPLSVGSMSVNLA
ncbi:MAG: PAS domain-containing protein [Rhizobiales bacterium]|nr:PAS domain-containing protein [Hyphomicrobiales bacterium]